MYFISLHPLKSKHRLMKLQRTSMLSGEEEGGSSRKPRSGSIVVLEALLRLWLINSQPVRGNRGKLTLCDPQHEVRNRPALAGWKPRMLHFEKFGTRERNGAGIARRKPLKQPLVCIIGRRQSQV